jgi:tRNA dimethylallyltransferase
MPAPAVDMEKLLIICGPTATGKTKLALELAKKFNGEIVSADSRQVYKHMDIGTGKDLPVNVKCQMSNVKTKGGRICFYEIDGVKLWGYDLVSPKKEFSVAQYERIARSIVRGIWGRKKLPILTGGTGLYIKAVIDGIETASIPKNVKLRKSLEDRTVKELFEMLSNVDPIKSASLNLSDRKNPRRLVRAIEIAQHNLSGKSKKRQTALKANILMIGLTVSKKMLDKRIKERVTKRINQGIEKEIEKLLKMGVNWNMQSMNTLGYKQWREYLISKKTKKEVIDKWIKDEIQYTKRQNTWFKKETYHQGEKRIKWFDISKRAYKKDIETEVKKWYPQE